MIYEIYVVLLYDTIYDMTWNDIWDIWYDTIWYDAICDV